MTLELIKKKDKAIRELDRKVFDLKKENRKLSNQVIMLTQTIEMYQTPIYD